MIENRLRRRHPLIQTIFDNWIYILVLIFLWRFPHLVADWTNSEVAPDSPRLASESKFWQGVMIEVFTLGILALSYNLMFGFTGLISFGHGAFYGVGVYSVAILMEKFQISFVKSIAVALCIGVLVALVWSVTAFRVKGVYFAMFTLAFAEIFLQVTKLTIFKDLTRGTGGEDSITINLPDWINPVRNRLQVYYIALACFVVAFLWVRRLMNSPSGKILLAIRDNPVRTQTLGFNIYLYKTLAIIISGMLATVAGVLHVVLSRQAEPTALGVERTVDPLIHSLIGGVGTIPGPPIGAAFLRIGQQFIRKSDLMVDFDFMIYRYTATINAEKYWDVALGGAFILFVLVVPYGVVGSVNRYWIEARQWGRKYLYNPLVRRNPKLATWAEPFTGEPPELCLLLANQPAEHDFIGWLKTYPIAATNAVMLGLPLILGLLAWNWRVAATWFLFLLLLSIPVRLAVLIWRWWPRSQ